MIIRRANMNSEIAEPPFCLFIESETISRSVFLHDIHTGTFWLQTKRMKTSFHEQKLKCHYVLLLYVLPVSKRQDLDRV